MCPLSRSNPTDTAVNPATRWFEWNGETGSVRYYDKDAKKNVDLGADFTFVLLDRLASVRGWHERSKSGIYSNAVKDTRADILVVKAFKGGIIAEGLYKTIKDAVNVAGGAFTADCYIAYKSGDGFKIGVIQFKKASLSAWMEFEKAQRNDLYKGAVKIDGFTEGKKGRIVYRMPVFKLVPLSAATNEIAMELDKELQAYLSVYLKRTKTEQVEPHVAAAHDGPRPEDFVQDEEDNTPMPDDEDPIPF